MKSLVILTLIAFSPFLKAGVSIDVENFGDNLGGWDKHTVEYGISGSKYRTHKPMITPTPDGGIFVSVRIDHERGWFSNDDHAVLEVSFGPDGDVTSAQTSLAIQGRTISSDLIKSTAQAGTKLTPMAGAVKVGTDLVADLSSKMLREKIVEAGRVTYPSAVRHNYNILYQAMRVTKDGDAGDDSDKKADTKLEIKHYATPKIGPDKH